MPDSTPKPARWRRRLARRGVRAMMLLVLLAGLGLGWLVHRARVQREAVAALRRHGAQVACGHDYPPSKKGKPRGPGWLRKAIGDDYFREVARVHMPYAPRPVGDRGLDAEVLSHLPNLGGLGVIELVGETATDAGLARVRRLGRLEVLGLERTSGVTDDGLASIGEIRNLRRLSIDGASITDAGVAHLGRLARLEDLTLRDVRLTDAGLAHIDGLTRLRSLDVARNPLTDAGLARIGRRAGLVRLAVGGVPIEEAGEVDTTGGFGGGTTRLVAPRGAITDAGLARLSGLVSLRSLGLEYADITDAGLDHLRGMTRLEFLLLGGSRVTPEGVARLRAALPSLKHVSLNPMFQ